MHIVNLVASVVGRKSFLDGFVDESVYSRALLSEAFAANQLIGVS